MDTDALNDLALLQHELQGVAATALNRELSHKHAGMRLASPRRARRVIAEAMAAHLASRLVVDVDPATKRIEVRWPCRGEAPVSPAALDDGTSRLRAMMQTNLARGLSTEDASTAAKICSAGGHAWEQHGSREGKQLWRCAVCHLDAFSFSPEPVDGR